MELLDNAKSDLHFYINGQEVSFDKIWHLGFVYIKIWIFFSLGSCEISRPRNDVALLPQKQSYPGNSKCGVDLAGGGL